MRLKNEVKVGIIVTAGIAVLIGIYWFLGGLGIRASTYPIYALLPNAQRLEKGALVRMAGVKVGLVLGTSLTHDNKARVELLIDKPVRIPEDSVAKITTGAFIGEYYVQIIPGRQNDFLQPGERIEARTLVQPDEILERVDDVLAELRGSAQGVNRVLGDKELVSSLKASVIAMRRAIESAAATVEAAGKLVTDTSPAAVKAVENLEAATAGAERAVAQIETTIASDLRPRITETLDRAGSALKRLDEAIQQAQHVVAGFAQTPGKINDNIDKLGTAFDDARAVAANLKEASAGIKSIAADEQVQEDLRTALRNAAAASEQLRQLTESLNAKYGKAKRAKAERGSVPDAGLVTTALWNTDSGNYRLDANYTFALSGGAFLRAGAFSIGEDSKLNIQTGRVYGNTALRYGLYASRLGVGFDQRLGRRFALSGDVFRPNRPEMELRGVADINSAVGIYGGVYDLLHGPERDFYLGVQYRSK